MSKQKTITGAIFTCAHREINKLRKKINVPASTKKGKKKK